ncbi:MAG TPA: glycosyltransferase family 39 protein [Rhodanobacteraceae bacterium]|nr:glycosyltransferase family 39 protein [Rhodanobacteraceae bacterium]
MPNGTPVSVTATLRWRRAFIALFALLQLGKLLLAVRLPPFADEAFYWQESRHLAWGYSDLPGLTAWLIRLGQAMAGDGVLAMRWPFLLLGAALPWLVVAWSRRHVTAVAAWQAGLLALGMPLLGTLGVLALPDVPLTAAAMLSLLFLDRALEARARWPWLALGLSLAVLVASHYRAAMMLIAGLLFVVLTPRGRRVWRHPGWYGALLLGALGVVPTLLYNVEHQWAGLAFQAVDRNPWRFHADALRQPLEQALVTTPMLYALLLWALWRSLCRRWQGAPWDVAGMVGISFVLGYFLGGLFADDLRFRLHWPLPGYLPLLALVPGLLAGLRWRRVWVAALGITLVLAQAATMTVLLAASQPGDGAGMWRANGVARAFAGWPQAVALVARQLADEPGRVLVADNFKLAAELDFGLRGSRVVYVLDSPANSKHGRAVQLADWHRDAAALRRQQAGASALLAVEETSLREAARPEWLGSLCANFDRLQAAGRLDLPHMDRHIALYRARVRAHPHYDSRGRDGCVIWREAHRVAYPLARDAGAGRDIQGTDTPR